MGRKAKNLKREMMTELDEMRCFGQKKHLAKAEARKKYEAENMTLKGWNPASVPGKIFSLSTHHNYKKMAAVFASFAKQQGVNRRNAVTPELCTRFLQHEEEIGKSAWTVSLEMSALNKVFEYGLTKENCNLSKRQKTEIKRSRGGLTELAATRVGTYLANKDQITMARGTGMRRESMTRITADSFIYGQDGLVWQIRLRKEKGGKDRVAPILPRYREAITRIVAQTAPGERIFKEYDHHIDNHSLRAEYANELADELSKNGLDLCGLDCSYLVNPQGKDLERKRKVYGLALDVAAAISGALGHNRIGILGSYLYKRK